MNRTTRIAAPSAMALLLGLAGCASLPMAAPRCPDLSGRYVNQADAGGDRLAAVLIGDVADAAPGRTVALQLDAGQQALKVDTEGLPTVSLQRGRDFSCGAQGLRLLRPTRASTATPAGTSAPGVDTAHSFSKQADGSLVAEAAAGDGARRALRWTAAAAP